MRISRTLRRGLFHILGGLSISVAGLFLPKTILLIPLGTVTFVLLAFEFIRFRVPAANRWFFKFYRPLARTSETSRLTGASYMLVGSLISFVLFQRDIAVIALSFMAVGDAAGGIFGRQVGKRRLFGKTLEGDLACLISCAATGAVCYYAGLSVPLPIILVGAVSATAVEAISLPVNDNLTMPLFAGAVMTIMQMA